MKGTADVVKGRIEEAAGALTGSNRLRAKGQMDQAVGQVERGAEKGVRQAKKSARKIVDSAKDVAQKTVAGAKSRY
jgi:uncharacterized protein YjbJ (UPF0337 family)